MNADEWEGLLLQVLDLPDHDDPDSRAGILRAALIGALGDAEGARDNSPGLSPEQIAAYVDGKLDGEDIRRVRADFVISPDLFHDAMAFLEHFGEVAARKETAPDDLLAAALARRAMASTSADLVASSGSWQGSDPGSAK